MRLFQVLALLLLLIALVAIENSLADNFTALNATDPVAWYNKGNAFLNSSNYNEAIQCYNNATNLKPLYAEAWKGKGKAFQDQGDKNKEAQECFDKARSIEYLNHRFKNQSLIFQSDNLTGLVEKSNGFIGILFFLPFLLIFLLSRISIRRSRDFSEYRSGTTDNILQDLENFRGIRNPALHWAIRVLTGILLLATLWLIFLKFGLGIQVINSVVQFQVFSELLALGLGFLVAQTIMRLIPNTLLALWNRNILAVKLKAGFEDAKPNEEKMESSNIPTESGLLREQYLEFIHDFEDQLNQPLFQCIVSGVFLALIWFPYFYVWNSYYKGYNNVLLFFVDTTKFNFISLSLAGLEVLVLLVAFFVVCVALGVLVWRLIVTARMVRLIGTKFDLNPKLGHPDECGGLSPIGDLCLWIALAVSIMGLHLAGWTIIGPILDPSLDWRFYSMLLPAPIALAIFCFFWPLWSIHKVMISKKAEVLRQLNRLGERINDIEQEMLDRAHELEPEETEKNAKKLELLRQTYKRNQHYSTWPFNAEIWKKLVISQAIPLLGLLPGVGKPILDMVKIIVESLGQYWRGT